MRRGRLLVPHRAPARPAPVFLGGDVVRVGHRDTDWPGFAWTTGHDGVGGWVPAELIGLGSDGIAFMTTAYDTRELDAEAGELVVLHREIAHWWWCENAAGDTGWIPARAITPHEDTP